MGRTVIAVEIMAVLLGAMVGAVASPLSEDTSYAAYRKGPCDRCVPGVKPALSSTYWLETATQWERYPSRPWLTIRVNGRDTDLGKVAWVLDRELMLPVMSAQQFGLTATRSSLNHQLLTLSGGRYLVKLRIDSRRAEVGYRLVMLPVCPKWHNGKVYMPLESIGKLLNWEFSFNKLTGVLSITTTGPDLVSYRTAGDNALARGLHDEAAAEYLRAIQLDPEDWLLRRRLGDALTAKAQLNDELAAAHEAILEALQRVSAAKALAERQPQTGAPVYAQAVKEAAGRVDLYRQLSTRFMTLTDVREPDQALDVYERTLFIDPAANRVPRTAPSSLISAQELQEAIKQAGDSATQCRTRARDSREAGLAAFREAIARAPAGVNEYRALAEAYVKAGRDREAAEAYQKALAVDPTFAQVRLDLAQALLGQGKWQDAAAEAQQVIAADPKNAAAHNMLGYALRKQGRLEEAVAAYRAAIAADPGFALAHNNLGVALLALNKPQEATTALSQAVAAAPERPDFRGNLGLALFESKRVSDAAEAWRAAVAMAPDAPEFHAYLAMALQRLGDVDGALAESQLALDKFGAALAATAAVGGVGRQEAEADLNRARILAQVMMAWGRLEKGRMSEALAAAQEATRLAPEDPAAQAVLAAVATDLLDTQTASRAIDRALAAQGDNGLYRAIAAACRALAGQKQEAETQAAEAARLLAGVPDRWGWHYLGRAYASLGQVAKAVAAYNQPQPVNYDPTRRAQVQDYLARHPVSPQPAAAPRLPAAGGVLPASPEEMAATGDVQVTSAPSDVDKPTLSLANKTTKTLTVVLEREGNKQVWGLPAGETTPARELPAGIYAFTIREADNVIGNGRMACEARNAYTLIVGGQ